MGGGNSEVSSQAYTIKHPYQIKDAEFSGKHKVGKVGFCLKSTFPGAWEEEQQWNSAKGGDREGGGEFLH